VFCCCSVELAPRVGLSAAVVSLGLAFAELHLAPGAAKTSAVVVATAVVVGASVHGIWVGLLALVLRLPGVSVAAVARVLVLALLLAVARLGLALLLTVACLLLSLLLWLAAIAAVGWRLGLLLILIGAAIALLRLLLLLSIAGLLRSAVASLLRLSIAVLS